ncbi:chemotaxis protein CheW [Brevibacillus migulae]|uniref:chemotaxis protein CheW n=1 Tax=Brevibacillus migulae TaxID=1644114 RepID=UPI001431B927|nr:chemotaxis protein CheW [Brevibacillus migulae]
MSNQPASQKEIIFRIDREEYAISVMEVVSIEKPHELTPVPKQNPYVLGVIHLRGQVVPIIDLRKILNESASTVTDSTRYIIASVAGQVIGFVVDAATDILDVPASTIQKPALFSKDFIYGIAKLEDRMIVLLDIPRLLESALGDISLSEITSIA